MRRIKIMPLLIASVVLAAVIGLAACGDDGGGGGEKFDLKIGDIVPLTGDLADFGPPGRKAADLAVDRDQEGDQAGRRRPDGHDPARGRADRIRRPSVSAARKLADAGVELHRGRWASADTIPIAKSVAIREKILQISPASTAASIADLEDDGYLDRDRPAGHAPGPRRSPTTWTTSSAARRARPSTSAPATTSTEPDSPTRSRRSGRRRGGKIGQKVIYDPEQPSYNSEAQKIASGNPDALRDRRLPRDLRRRWARRWCERASGMRRRRSSPTAWPPPTCPKNVGARGDGGHARNGCRDALESGAASEAFDKLYTSAPGHERQTFDAQNFDAVMLCYLAAVAAGSATARR